MNGALSLARAARATRARAQGVAAAIMACLALACRDPSPAPPDELGRPPVIPEGSRRPADADDRAPLVVRNIPIRELCVTSGRLHPARDQVWINSRPALRATASNSAGHHAALVFRYLGSTETSRPLASGVERHQLGLKLLSRDTCNVVYVMWRFDARSSVVASIKDNPDFARHAQCGNRGYRSIRPYWRAPVDPPAPGTVYELSATIRTGLLEARIDGRPVLRVVLAGQRTPVGGTSGLRSDNVRFELLAFKADRVGQGAPRPPCRN